MVAKKSFEAATTDTGAGNTAPTPLTKKQIQSEFNRFLNAVDKNQGYQEIIQEWGAQKHLPTMLKAKRNDGWTALMSAVSANRRIDIVQALLAAGKRCGIEKNMLRAKNKYGWTALLIAARSGQTEAVQVLLAAGKEHGILKKMLRHKNSEGETVFDVVVFGRNFGQNIVKSLEDAALEEAFGKDVFIIIDGRPETRSGLVSHAKQFVMGEIGKKSLKTARAKIAAELRKDAEEQIKNAEKQIKNAEKTKKLADSFEKAGAGSKGNHQDSVPTTEQSAEPKARLNAFSLGRC